MLCGAIEMLLFFTLPAVIRINRFLSATVPLMVGFRPSPATIGAR
jgi:hypothetical protein